MNISIKDLQQAVSCLQDARKHAVDYLNNISQVLESMKEIGRYRNITEADLTHKWVATLRSYSDRAAFHSVLISNSTSRLATICDVVPGLSEVSAELKDKLGVEVYIGNKMLCVKTPTLLSRNRMVGDNRFGERVAELLIERSEDLPRISNKSILVFNVYSKQYPRLFRIDPDNLDSKNVVDKITLFYGGDSGKNTTYICMEHVADDIPQGTYTLCIPKEDTVLDPDKIAAAIKDLMAADNSAKV